MHARPFVLLGKSALEAYRARATQALAGWCAAWGVPCDAAQVDCEPAAVEEGGELAAAIASLWADRAVEGSIVHGVATRAARDLDASLRAALRGDAAVRSTQVGDELRARGSGALNVVVSIASASRVLLLAHGELFEPARVVSAAIPLAIVDAKAAAQGASLALQAEVASLDLDLAAVRSLCAGDVIRLGTRLGDPLAVTCANGTTLCHAHLGAYEGRRALDIVR